MIVTRYLRRSIVLTIGVQILLVAGLVPAYAAEDGKGPPSSAEPSSRTSAVHGLERAEVQSDGSLRVRDRVGGTGALPRGNITFEGIVSPGDSPGCINGDTLTFAAISILVIEIGGPTACTEYDRLIAAEQLTLNGAALEIRLLNGYLPAEGATFDILDWTTLSGRFGVVDTSQATLPDGLGWDTGELHQTGVLAVGAGVGNDQAVPVPVPWVTLLPLAAALVLFAFRQERLRIPSRPYATPGHRAICRFEAER